MSGNKGRKMEIDKIKEWVPPKGGYWYDAYETFCGDIFRLRTGERVSALVLARGGFIIQLCGKVEVTSDEECWAIVSKLNKISIVVDALVKNAHAAGKREAKQELNTWLRT
jgi:hypothetical protein